jgi:hypothetical protein
MKIIYEDKKGLARVLIPSYRFMAGINGTDEEKLAFIAKKDLPDGTQYTIVDDSDIPTSRIFREAWIVDGGIIKEDLTKSKELSHTKRREKRAEDFAPLDIKATIPSEADSSEVERQKIRDKYAVMQDDIEAAKDITALKKVINDLFN